MISRSMARHLEPLWLADFSYGLTKGCARRSLETLIAYQIQQGILDEKPDIESLFFPEALK